ncbi:SHOCT domain-containing protein [Cryobacterium fucosi]|uniref:SHOCT domain-containing protein n=1 Tax=Cryobacterium fucosi TaxID=1259157 RepID=A0A4R9BB52_9MICO|nr:hypothetical protein [Cryobacterium fucosi]TFD78283.1 hypothetical protein E3T48_07555 [Cryobacterium fucosi]
MMYWGGTDIGVWGYVLMIVSMVLFWGAVVTGIVLLVRSFGPSSERRIDQSGTSSAESILAERFARGEIDESEYTGRVAVLRGKDTTTRP